MSQSTNESAQAAIAYDSTLDQYLVVYIVQTATSWDVYGRFIAWNSPGATNPNEFPIIDWTSDQWNPKVAYNPVSEEFMVTWGNAPSPGVPYISARRVKADGSGFPDTAFAVDSGAACAQTGQYIVAWQSNTTDMSYNVYAWPLDTDGTTIGSPLLIDGTVDPEEAPDVTCDSPGSNFWIAMQGGHTGTIYRIIGTRIDKNQVVGLTWPAYAMSSSYSSILNAAAPAIASAGNSVLTIWEQEETSGATNYDIFRSLFYPSPVFIPFVSP